MAVKDDDRIIHIRLKADDLGCLKKEADAYGVPISTMARMLLLAKLRGRRGGRLAK